MIYSLGGGGTTYDYGFRIYNPNIGRFLSVDPLDSEYPFYTPYQFAGNMPVGFNNKERDEEGLGGGGATYDYGFRIYNPNIGRFLSVDPLSPQYPFYTPYQFAGNTPIQAIDLDGLEPIWSCGSLTPVYGGSQTQVHVVNSALEVKAAGALIGVEIFITKGWLGRIIAAYELGNTIDYTGKAERATSAGYPSLASYYQMKGGHAATGVLIGSTLEIGGKYLTNQFFGRASLIAEKVSGTYRALANHIQAGIRSIKNVTVNASGVKVIEKHLGNEFFQIGGEMAANNKVMIDRLKKIANGEMKATETDLYFYSHEMREAELMKSTGYNTGSYDAAHAAAAKEYGVTIEMEKQGVFYTQEADQALETQLINELNNYVKEGLY